MSRHYPTLQTDIIDDLQYLRRVQCKISLNYPMLTSQGNMEAVDLPGLLKWNTDAVVFILGLSNIDAVVLPRGRRDIIVGRGIIDAVVGPLELSAEAALVTAKMDADVKPRVRTGVSVAIPLHVAQHRKSLKIGVEQELALHRTSGSSPAGQFSVNIQTVYDYW